MIWSVLPADLHYDLRAGVRALCKEYPDTYWRGNVWPCVNWLIFKGLQRYGYNDLARELAENSVDLLKQSGFWEYYNPITGAGLGGSTFSWAAALLDMIATVQNENGATS